MIPEGESFRWKQYRAALPSRATAAAWAQGRLGKSFFGKILTKLPSPCLKKYSQFNILDGILI
ncbi:MAG: hypothetical protein CMI32_01735 [Opitutales bacterium]|nr:hypothetical protein [Opitutales bacterium]